MSNTANINRARLRKICRKSLSNHLEDKLKISVSPDRVRLRPTPEDQYRWKISRKGRNTTYEKILKEDMKNLSSLSTRAYQKLCDGLGEYFYAVHADEDNIASPTTPDKRTEDWEVFAAEPSCAGTESARCSQPPAAGCSVSAGEIQRLKDAMEVTTATSKASEMELQRVKRENRELWQITRKYWARARVYQDQAERLRAHLESHAAEIVKVMDTFQKGMEFKPPILPLEFHDSASAGPILPGRSDGHGSD